MSEPVVTTAIAAVAAVISAIITAVLARRTGAATNRVDAVEVTVTGMEKLVAALERELATVKDALLAEQQQHAATRELLRIAMRHIRDMLSWLGSDRAGEPPAVPDELTHQL